MVKDPNKDVPLTTRVYRPRGAAPTGVNVGLLARLGAIPTAYVKQRKKFNAEVRKGQRHQDYRIAGLNGKRAMERRARQEQKQKTKKEV